MVGGPVTVLESGWHLTKVATDDVVCARARVRYATQRYETALGALRELADAGTSASVDVDVIQAQKARESCSRSRKCLEAEEGRLHRLSDTYVTMMTAAGRDPSCWDLQKTRNRDVHKIIVREYDQFRDKSAAAFDAHCAVRLHLEDMLAARAELGALKRERRVARRNGRRKGGLVRELSASIVCEAEKMKEAETSADLRKGELEGLLGRKAQACRMFHTFYRVVPSEIVPGDVSEQVRLAMTNVTGGCLGNSGHLESCGLPAASLDETLVSDDAGIKGVPSPQRGDSVPHVVGSGGRGSPAIAGCHEGEGAPPALDLSADVVLSDRKAVSAGGDGDTGTTTSPNAMVGCVLSAGDGGPDGGLPGVARGIGSACGTVDRDGVSERVPKAFPVLTPAPDDIGDTAGRVAELRSSVGVKGGSWEPTGLRLGVGEVPGTCAAEGGHDACHGTEYLDAESYVGASAPSVVISPPRRVSWEEGVGVGWWLRAEEDAIATLHGAVGCHTTATTVAMLSLTRVAELAHPQGSLARHAAVVARDNSLGSELSAFSRTALALASAALDCAQCLHRSVERERGAGSPCDSTVSTCSALVSVLRSAVPVCEQFSRGMVAACTSPARGHMPWGDVVPGRVTAVWDVFDVLVGVLGAATACIGQLMAPLEACCDVQRMHPAALSILTAAVAALTSSPFRSIGACDVLEYAVMVTRESRAGRGYCPSTAEPRIGSVGITAAPGGVGSVACVANPPAGGSEDDGVPPGKSVAGGVPECDRFCVGLCRDAPVLEAALALTARSVGSDREGLFDVLVKAVQEAVAVAGRSCPLHLSLHVDQSGLAPGTCCVMHARAADGVGLECNVVEVAGEEGGAALGGTLAWEAGNGAEQPAGASGSLSSVPGAETTSARGAASKPTISGSCDEEPACAARPPSAKRPRLCESGATVRTVPRGCGKGGTRPSGRVAQSASACVLDELVRQRASLARMVATILTDAAFVAWRTEAHVPVYPVASEASIVFPSSSDVRTLVGQAAHIVYARLNRRLSQFHLLHQALRDGPSCFRALQLPSGERVRPYIVDAVVSLRS